MRIRIACGLDSRSCAGFWKNDRAAVPAVRTIQYNNLLFYLILYNIIYYIIFIIYYSSHSPSSLITESVCLVGKGRLKERCGLEPRTNFFFRLRNRQKLVRIRFGCGLDPRIYGIICLRLHRNIDVLSVSSKMLVFFYQTARCHIPDDIILHIPWREDVTSPNVEEKLKENKM